MEQESSSGTSSIAWFKLAELIARKEREKALNVFRLLSHSFNDRAYALQLEGDILFSLHDKGASEKHKQAAFLYQKEHQWVYAIALYEHLLSLDHSNSDLLAELIHGYAVIDWQEKFNERVHRICLLFSQKLIDENQFVKTFKPVADYLGTCETKDKRASIVISLQAVMMQYDNLPNLPYGF